MRRELTVLLAMLVALCNSIAGAQSIPILTPQGAPTEMRLCAFKWCQTLKWRADHYDAAADGDPSTVATYTIDQWSTKGISLKGTSLLEYKGGGSQIGQFKIPKRGHIEGTYTAVISNTGNSVDEAVVKYHGPFGSGESTFQLTWKTDKDDDEGGAVCSTPDASLSEPVNLTVCAGPCITEHNKNVGAWAFQGTKGKGSSLEGGRANLAIQEWDAKKIIIASEETPTSTNAGLSVVFVGKACGDTIKGSAKVTWPGHFENVKVPWMAVKAPTTCDGSDDDTQALIETGRELLFFRKLPAAFGCFARAAKLGNMDARTATALMYRDGLGTEVDYKQAKNLFTSAAIAGDYNADVAMAEMYDFGLGVQRDLGEVKLWRERAYNNPAAVAARQNQKDKESAQKFMFLGLCAMIEAFSRPTVYQVW